MLAVVVLSGCLGYPARSKMSSIEVAARVGTASNCVETIVAHFTFRRCVMLLTPEGAFQDWIHSVGKDYVLCRKGRSEAALPFLRDREWKKVMPVPSTNLWVAISQPERRGWRDDLDVVVFADDHLIRKRTLKTLALGPDQQYHGFLAFSAARWVIWYSAETGEVQYDVLRDAFISPLEEWAEGEATTLMSMPGDIAPVPPR